MTLLTIKEAATELRRSESWIRRQIRTHQLRSVKFGRNHRIFEEELRRFIERTNAGGRNETQPSNIEIYNERRRLSALETEGVKA